MAPLPAGIALRVGYGFDTHRYCRNRPFVLGGVTFEHPLGLAGHSDADVLLHAVMDALLGAAGLDDLGTLFPDTDPALAGVSSVKLLEQVMARLRADHWRVVNVDSTVVCELPKIGPRRAEIRTTLAPLLGVAPAAIGIKGKTAEQLGFTGRGEGVVAQAVVLLVRDDE